MTIGNAAFDAVHLVLAVVLAAVIAGGAWLRTRMMAEAVEQAHRLSVFESEQARLEQELQEARCESQASQDALLEAEKALAAAEARQESERRDFLAMANKAVEAAHRSFLNRADETFKRHDAAAKGRLEKLMDPIGKNFDEFKARVEALEKVRTEDKTAIFEQVKAISEQLEQTRSVTGKLVTALSAPKGGGRWGEETLRNVLEMAGLSAHADFVEQVHDAGEQGARRPDVVVRMPGGREIVIDAKVSVEDFLRAGEEADEALRCQHMATHARKMRDHVRRLASKEYWKNFDDRVDFVAMYVPGENFYAGALEADRDLFDFAARNRVLIVTPSTLIALAKAVAYGWRQEEAARNALEAARLGQELYDALRAMGMHVEKTGKALSQATGSYNAMVGSLQRNVLPKARKFEDLQITQSGQKPLAELTMIEDQPRLPDRAGELAFTPEENGDDEEEAA
ncbi:MAG: DNA recombination protein RmuC [Hyphomonadaceae bacterium]|nr:DNA recombination protein RmuC [Hyphomonadaceae bacterium]